MDEDLFSGYTHKVVEVDDVDDENLLEHFPSCNEFIQNGLDAGGSVLVHWLVSPWFLRVIQIFQFRIFYMASLTVPACLTMHTSFERPWFTALLLLIQLYD